MIIDTHAHYGHDYVFDEDNYDDTLLYYYNKYKIDYAIIQPSIPRPYIDETAKIHDEIYNLCQKHNNRFFGMASINPLFKPEDYDAELTRCIKKLGFVGVKITPIGHAAHPALESCLHVYEICRSLKIPVMIHTGSDISFANPINILAPAKAFPDIKFILAHAGGDILFTAALYVAEICNNVYLEPSFLNIYALKSAIDKIGPDRVMFSSDMPMNVPVELVKYRTITEDSVVLDKLFYKTALEVFKLNL